MSTVKIRKIGNSMGVLLPKELLDSVGVSEGDALYVTRGPEGLHLSPYDPQFAAALEFAEEYLRDNRDAFRELSRR